MDLKDFKEFIRNKRRNEFLKLKQTKKYQDAQQGYDLMYKDVNDEVMDGLQESVRRKAKVAAVRSSFIYAAADLRKTKQP